MHDNSQLDRLLDSALKTYAEPEAGLEDRVLSSIAKSFHSPMRPSLRRHWLYWVAAVPVAACLLFVFTVRRSPQSDVALHAPAQLPELTATNHPAQREQPFATNRTHVQPPSKLVIHAQYSADRAVSKSAVRSKLAVFPTPQPLTPQERALYALATQVPEDQRQAILNARKNDSAPLDIAAIRIPPLEMPEEGKN